MHSTCISTIVASHQMDVTHEYAIQIRVLIYKTLSIIFFYKYIISPYKIGELTTLKEIKLITHKKALRHQYYFVFVYTKNNVNATLSFIYF